jgi:hypothetical protein
MANNNLPERVVNALQTSAAALQEAEKQMSEKQAADQRYAAGIPAVVEKCVQYGAIENTPEEREKLAAWLKTPEGALQVIDKLAEWLPAQQPAQTKEAAARMGQPVDQGGFPAKREKTAYAGGGYVGRKSGDKPESWKRLELGLGLSL